MVDEPAAAAVGKPEVRVLSQAVTSGEEEVRMGSGLLAAGIGEVESMAKVLSKAETVIGVLLG